MFRFHLVCLHRVAGTPTPWQIERERERRKHLATRFLGMYNGSVNAVRPLV